MSFAQQEFPNKPIRIFTAEPGGNNDVAARLIAPGLTARLGQSIVVENRPSLTLPDTVAKAAPDGHTLTILGPYPNWILPFMRDNVPYDMVRDFVAISNLSSSPSLLVVNASVPAKSVKELIALAKAKPGVLNYGSSSTGGSPHLSAELFKVLAGVNIVAVPYKGTGAAVNALIGNEVQLQFPAAGAVTQHVASGRLRALAVTSAQPSALFPALPTMAATLPGFELETILVLFAPAKTPTAVITRLNQEAVRAVSQPELKERFLSIGSEVIGSTPEQSAATVKSVVAKMGKVIKDAGIRADD